ncbi:hypothetical protein JCM21900_000273 [Sporobolomyces salmonicolor]
MAGKKQQKQVEEEEPEYEVEAIMKHKRDAQGVLKYFVQWVGFGREDDSWEPEENVAHLDEKLNEYWESVPESKRLQRYAPWSKKYKALQKALKGESAATPKSASKKRGAAAIDDSDDEEVAVKNIKARAQGKKKVKAEAEKGEEEAAPVEDGYDPEGREIVEWEPIYGDKQGWEDLVDKIDTVERDDEDGFKMYIVWKDNKGAWVPNTIARERCPQKIIDFYESHLKFRTRDADAIDE